VVTNLPPEQRCKRKFSGKLGNADILVIIDIQMVILFSGHTNMLFKCFCTLTWNIPFARPEKVNITLSMIY